MSQSHLTIDFPIKGPANAKALTAELPSLMPDFAKTQDQLGTVHFSRFMVKGDEKLLFLSDIDGEVDKHIDRLVVNAGPVFDTIFEHVDDPPATPVAGNPQRVIKWLNHIREPLDTYSAYEDASVQDIKEAARAAGVTGKASQGTLLTYLPFKSRVQGFVLKLVARLCLERRGTQRRMPLGRCISTIGCPLRKTTWASSQSTTVLGKQDMHDFATKTSFLWDALFPHVKGAPPPPVAKDVPAFSQYLAENNYPAIGFYSAYPGLSVQDIRTRRPIASHTRPPRDSTPEQEARRNTMSQSHLVIDFPIKGPANAKALPNVLPPLMPDLAKAQDRLGTVHYSRFMVKGDEKLLFLSDIDGEVDQHVERLVESAGPVLEAIFKHVDDAPATPVAGNPQGVVKWLKHHVREPLDLYFAYEDARFRTSRQWPRGGRYRQ